MASTIPTNTLRHSFLTPNSLFKKKKRIIINPKQNKKDYNQPKLEMKISTYIILRDCKWRSTGLLAARAKHINQVCWLTPRGCPQIWIMATLDKSKLLSLFKKGIRWWQALVMRGQELNSHLHSKENLKGSPSTRKWSRLKEKLRLDTNVWLLETSFHQQVAPSKPWCFLPILTPNTKLTF